MTHGKRMKMYASDDNVEQKRASTYYIKSILFKIGNYEY